MSDNIAVAVRVRPINTRELMKGSKIHWKTLGHDTISQINPATQQQVLSYTYDRVFDESATNEQVYAELVLPIVQSAMAGFNGTVFAYGQTSSGKTHTMTGDVKNPGILPLCIQHIFQSIEDTPDREFLLRASYMEIYQENITDLLTNARLGTPREDTTGNIIVPGLEEVCATSEQSLLQLIARGQKNRKVGETLMNDQSSRSHTIFRLILESQERTDNDGDVAIAVSHLNMVDLAGSENVSQTGATGERLKEGGSINRSLFMLGRVIAQLSDGEPHVNFRDSKLTRILQASLGGNAKTVVISTVTPVSKEQTLSTLRFASSAKSIKNKPMVNEVLSEAAMLKRCKVEIKKLKEALDSERNTNKAQEVEQVKELLDEQEKKNQDLEDKIRALNEKLIVSSHPMSIVRKATRKNRRETWAAPLLRPRPSFCAPRQPLSSWDTSSLKCIEEIPEVSSVHDETKANYSFRIASESLLESATDTADSFVLPETITVKRKRKVHYALPTANASCQTEESRVKSPSTPKTPRCPKTPFGMTPRRVLYSRIDQLSDKLEQESSSVQTLQQSMDELAEFQRLEVELLKEEYQTYDIAKFKNEMLSLKKSLHDSEMLYLDVQRESHLRSQEIYELKSQLANYEDIETNYEELQTAHERLKQSHENMAQELKDKTKSLIELEKEKDAWNFQMELALEKQKSVEEDLRLCLKEAWDDLAKYEDCDARHVLETRREHKFQYREALKQIEDLKLENERKQNEMEHQIQLLTEELKEKSKLLAEDEVGMEPCSAQDTSKVFDDEEQGETKDLNMILSNKVELSRKLSQTIMVLEESMVSHEDYGGLGDYKEVQLIKEQLIALQEALISSDDLQQQQDHEWFKEIELCYANEWNVVSIYEDISCEYFISDVKQQKNLHVLSQNGGEILSHSASCLEFNADIFNKLSESGDKIILKLVQNSATLPVSLADELKMAAMNDSVEMQDLSFVSVSSSPNDKDSIITHLKEQLESNNEELENVVTSLMEKEEMLESKEIEFNNLQHLKDNLERELALKLQELKQFKNTLDDNHTAVLNQSVTSLQMQHTSHKQTEVDELDQFPKLHKSVVETHWENVEFTANNLLQSQRYRSNENQLLDDDYTALKRELTVTKENLQSKTSLVQELESNLHALHSNLNTTNAELSEVQTQLMNAKKLHDTNSSLQEELISTKENLHALQSDLSRTNIELCEVRTQLITAKNENQELKGANSSLQNELTSTKENLQTKVSLVHELERNLHTLHSELNKTNIELSELQTQLQTAINETQKLAEANSTLKEELTSAKDNLQTKVSLVHELERNLHTLHAELNETAVKLCEVQTQLQAAKTETQELNDYNTLLQEELASAKKNVNGQISRLNEPSSNLHSVLSDLSNRNTQLPPMETQLTGCQNEAHTLQYANSFVHEELSSTNENLRAQVSPINTIESGLDAMTKHAASSVLDKAINEVSEVKAQLEASQIEDINATVPEVLASFKESSPAEVPFTNVIELDANQHATDSNLKTTIQLSELRIQFLDAENEIQKLRDRNASIQEELASIKANEQAQVSHLHEFETHLRTTTMTHDTSSEEKTNGELSKVRNQLLAVENEVQKLKETNASLQEELASVNVNLQAQVLLVNELETKTRATSSNLERDTELSEIRTQLMASQMEAQKLESFYKRQVELKCQIIEEMVATDEERLKELDSLKQALQHQSAVTTNQQLVQDDNSEMKNIKHFQISQESCDETQMVHNDLDDIDLQCNNENSLHDAQLQKANSELLENLHETSMELSKTKALYNEARNELEALKHSHSLLVSNIKGLEVSDKEVQGALIDSQNKVLEMNSEIKCLQSQIGLLEQRSADVCNKSSELECTKFSELGNYRAVNISSVEDSGKQSLLECTNDLQANFPTLSDTETRELVNVDSYDVRCENHKQSVQLQQDHMDSLKTDNEKLKEKLSKCNDEFGKLKSQNFTLQSEKNILLQKIAQLENNFAENAAQLQSEENIIESQLTTSGKITPKKELDKQQLCEEPREQQSLNDTAVEPREICQTLDNNSLKERNHSSANINELKQLLNNELESKEIRRSDFELKHKLLEESLAQSQFNVAHLTDNLNSLNAENKKLTDENLKLGEIKNRLELLQTENIKLEEHLNMHKQKCEMVEMYEKKLPEFALQNQCDVKLMDQKLLAVQNDLIEKDTAMSELMNKIRDINCENIKLNQSLKEQKEIADHQIGINQNLHVAIEQKQNLIDSMKEKLSEIAVSFTEQANIEKNRLLCQIQNSNEKISKLEELCLRLQSDLEKEQQSSQRVTELEEICMRLESELEKEKHTNQKATELEKLCMRLQCDLEKEQQFSQRVTELEEICLRLESELKKEKLANQKATELEKLCVRLQCDLEKEQRFSRRVTELEELLSSELQSKEIIKQEYQSKQNVLEQSVESLREQLSQSEKEMTDINYNYDYMESQLTKTRQQCLKLEKDVEVTQKEKISLQKCLNQANKNKELLKHYEMELEKLRTQKDELLEHGKGSHKTIASLMKNNSLLTADVQKHKKELSDLKSQHAILLKDYERSQIDLKQKETKNQRHMSPVSEIGSSIVNEARVIQLKNNNYHLEKGLEELKKKVAIQEQAVTHYKAKAQEWKNKCTEEVYRHNKLKNSLQRKEQPFAEVSNEMPPPTLPSKVVRSPVKATAIEKKENEIPDVIADQNLPVNNEKVLSAIRKCRPQPDQDKCQTQ